MLYDYKLTLPNLLPRVIDGADTTLDAMEKVPVNEKNRPLHEIRLKRVSVKNTSEITFPNSFTHSPYAIRSKYTQIPSRPPCWVKTYPFIVNYLSPNETDQEYL